MATMEEQVASEQEEHEAAERAAEQERQEGDTSFVIDEEMAAAVATDPEGKALFDRSQYEREELQLARVDGNQVDRISLKFSGTVFLDRSQPADVALYRKLALGRDVTIVVEGRCNSTGAKGATDREGDLDVVVGEKGVKVHTVYLSIEDGISRNEEGEPVEEEAQAA